MWSRLIAGALAAGALLALAAPASAQIYDDRFTGGAPMNGLYRMYGAPIAKTTVSFAGDEAPATA